MALGLAPMYYSRVSKAQHPPISIRPGAARVARIDAYATKHMLSRHLAVMVLLDAGLRVEDGPLQKDRPAKRILDGLKDAVEIAEGRADPSTYRVHNVQLGPTPAKPGDRLKKGKAK